MVNTKEIALQCAKILDAKKGQDITIIDIAEKSGFADYLVVVSANNERLIGALAQDLEDEMAKSQIFVKGIEGRKESGWILMDYGDIIVNVFSEAMRSRYNIEKVWGDCNFIEFEEGK